MKKSIKLFLISFTFMALSPTIFSKDCIADEIQISESTIVSDSEITTYSDNIVWKYKIINGKLYKRKYNSTKKKWVGSWIPA